MNKYKDYLFYVIYVLSQIIITYFVTRNTLITVVSSLLSLGLTAYIIFKIKEINVNLNNKENSLKFMSSYFKNLSRGEDKEEAFNNSSSFLKEINFSKDFNEMKENPDLVDNLYLDILKEEFKSSFNNDLVYFESSEKIISSKLDELNKYKREIKNLNNFMMVSLIYPFSLLVCRLAYPSSKFDYSNPLFLIMFLSMSILPIFASCLIIVLGAKKYENKPK